MTKTKQQTIQYLTDLMGVIQDAYYKGRMEGHPLWVHERMDDSAAISIDLYNFGGDGKPVCEGLNPCIITFDDGSTWKGNVYCMTYDPGEEPSALGFLSSFDEWGDGGDLEIQPESLPEDALRNIAEWLEQAMQPKTQETKDGNNVTSFFFYMWNRWCKDECEVVWKDDDYNHFWKKWCGLCDRYGRFGAVEEFYAELSNHNRDKLVKRACECYEGQKEKE